MRSSTQITKRGPYTDDNLCIHTHTHTQISTLTQTHTETSYTHIRSVPPSKQPILTQIEETCGGWSFFFDAAHASRGFLLLSLILHCHIAKKRKAAKPFSCLCIYAFEEYTHVHALMLYQTLIQAWVYIYKCIVKLGED